MYYMRVGCYLLVMLGSVHPLRWQMQVLEGQILERTSLHRLPRRMLRVQQRRLMHSMQGWLRSRVTKMQEEWY